ncbi:MAG: hypothetical protein GXO83_09115 [Chlorobi bacterium]|nr:hypothetical protein [Chlorobiota bacterium]
MKSIVAVYDMHKEAVNAVRKLNDNNFPMNHVSLAGKAEVVGDHVHIKSLEPMKNAPAFIGAGAGTIIGLLTGIGAFAIPGFGFLYGAGALVGIVGGFDLGIVSGGLITILASLGIDRDEVVEYQKHLEKGKFLVIVNGSEKEIGDAKKILNI